ncbi:unnamed protein product [Vicia faba]|uniref:Uncharacterized protein n=1 Tax=Vicia faba TaxID=3906 RepID=A0AAV0ZQN9_VICFA|nr:unnamed protein product [Vicia faba]
MKVENEEGSMEEEGVIFLQNQESHEILICRNWRVSLAVDSIRLGVGWSFMCSCYELVRGLRNGKKWLEGELLRGCYDVWIAAYAETDMVCLVLCRFNCDFQAWDLVLAREIVAW